MVERMFQNHRSAALALLTDCTGLSHKEAGFLGHVTITPVLSDKQSDWLATLLAKHNFPPFENAYGSDEE
jgi:hypothetical protein